MLKYTHTHTANALICAEAIRPISGKFANVNRSNSDRVKMSKRDEVLEHRPTIKLAKKNPLGKASKNL